nr:MAG TPA: hypothetical protein [Caudoviricetes sp.]
MTLTTKFLEYQGELIRFNHLTFVKCLKII